ncbi:fimbrial chaperone [Salmonella enterica subsp. enterica serovar Oranienburg]|nr:fimbrial chaperone protein [Salmonella enterica subsp. enterica serovar Telelkebir]EHB2254377.1 fimbrial chaperone [Salmonella enterica subsp. enterica serovar Oranienburg]EHE7835200.1 fimbrial chaperone [Salmonella enterica subsp. enterica serovar Oranienburg]EHV6763257.1 fimbrial chaperone [Salmonella enterica subsp. enterica serovar Johannesburg]
MNKFAKGALAAVLSFAFCSQSMAAFVLNGTRFIYDEGKKNVSFTVTNEADKSYGGQVWIDNTNQGNGVYMVPQPPFFKVGAKQKQIIRIMSTDASLPKDRESLFWLNVQEIPPKPEVKDTAGSVLAIAMNTRVKVIYRPSSIKNGRQDAEKQLILEQRGNETWLKNPTPYYMAVVSMQSDGKKVVLSDQTLADIAQLKPFSDVSLGRKVTGKVSVDAINDWGGTESYTIR